ncbi:MAG: AAA family ATPase [bacterium]|nr:AAA family ATPase [bacterium]
MEDIQTFIFGPWGVVIAVIIGGLYFVWQRRGKSFSGLSGTSMLGIYTRDLTAEARAGGGVAVIGRQNEIERVIHILARKTKNNPILLGEAGVGKTAIVEGLVQRIIAADVPETLKDKRLLGLDLGGLISGTKYRGEFEERVKKLLGEILREKRKVILFIDEVHMIVQAKGSEGALNVSDILKPALARGDLQAIGATTQEEYERYIKPDDALDRRFQPVLVGEPVQPDALLMLEGIKKTYEDYHRVEFSKDALEAAVALSAKYIKGRYLPDKAIDLIDEAGAKVGIEESHEARCVAGLLHAAGCKQNEKKRAHDGKTPIVSVEDIREIVAEWVGIKVEKIV